MQGVRHTENVEFMDLTDREDMEFRVSWFFDPFEQAKYT